MRNSRSVLVLVIGAVIGVATSAQALTIDYTAATGQTATAEFKFADATHLKIELRETTLAGAVSITGSGAILTSLGFLLPDSAVIALPDSVTIGAGSASVGFDQGDLGAGTDISGEWGATVGGEAPIDGIGSYDFVTAMRAQSTPFGGVNRDGPVNLDGPQGGLLDDSAASGGLGVVDSSVDILLTLDADPWTAGLQGLSSDQQAVFMGSLLSNSVVEYGSDEAFGYPDQPIPEPCTMLLMGTGLLGLASLARRRERRAV